MTNLRTGLLHYGFAGDGVRLDAIVGALKSMDFFVLEDLRCAKRCVHFMIVFIRVAIVVCACFS